jgi:hypothetical protein
MNYKALINSMTPEQRSNARRRLERLGGRVVTAEELLATLLGRRPARTGKRIHDLRPAADCFGAGPRRGGGTQVSVGLGSNLRRCGSLPARRNGRRAREPE